MYKIVDLNVRSSDKETPEENGSTMVATRHMIQINTDQAAHSLESGKFVAGSGDIVTVGARVFSMLAQLGSAFAYMYYVLFSERKAVYSLLLL